MRPHKDSATPGRRSEGPRTRSREKCNREAVDSRSYQQRKSKEFHIRYVLLTYQRGVIARPRTGTASAVRVLRQAQPRTGFSTAVRVRKRAVPKKLVCLLMN